jgi:enolase
MEYKGYSGEYGPHPMQEGLRSLYEKVDEAERAAPSGFKIKDIYCFPDQKHGMKPIDAISFGIVLENGTVNKRAGVMGGISAGTAEPGTHDSIDKAVDFFNKNIRKSFIGLNVSQPGEITNKIIELDELFKSKSGDTNKPLFSYIGSEISVGISMICSIGFAERLGVPLEIILNYRYNKYCLTNKLSEEIRPITIPVNYSVVWEGGKHGAALTLKEMMDKEIMADASEFPGRFLDKERIKKKDKKILLGMVPPQEVQVMTFVPNWEQARNLGIKLTKIYQDKLKQRGINIEYGAESGCTTKQTHTGGGELITLELILDILNEATDALGDDSNYVRWALDIASSEMYIPEIDRYFIGPRAAGNKSGLVTNDQFTRYKLDLFKKYPRFISVEDWADESKMGHWETAKQIMPYMIQMGDDNVVSNAQLIEKFKDVQNAHLQKPNQSAEEQAMIAAVGTSHKLGNAVVFSHRGTRPADEDYTATAAMGMGGFAGKWTLWGIGRGALIAAMNQADQLYNRGPYKNVKVPYQGEMVLDTDGPYQQGWAKRLREEIKTNSLKIPPPNNSPRFS